jgi:hypothetical protein
MWERVVGHWMLSQKSSEASFLVLPLNPCLLSCSRRPLYHITAAPLLSHCSRPLSFPIAVSPSPLQSPIPLGLFSFHGSLVRERRKGRKERRSSSRGISLSIRQFVILDFEDYPLFLERISSCCLVFVVGGQQ